jgi:hypothetical protein
MWRSREQGEQFVGKGVFRTRLIQQSLSSAGWRTENQPGRLNVPHIRPGVPNQRHEAGVRYPRNVSFTVLSQSKREARAGLLTIISRR